MKNLFRKVLISLLFVIILIPLILYFFVFHGELSKDVNDWITFGTIWGSVFTGLSIFILVNENIKNKDNQLFQKVIEIHDIQIKRIQENDTRNNLDKEKGTESVHTGKENYFSYFNNLMKTELQKGIVSFLFEIIEENENRFLDNENLKTFFFMYIADQIDIPEDLFVKYHTESKELTDNEKNIVYDIWNKSDKKNLSKNYIHHFSYNKNKNTPIGMTTVTPIPDRIFERYLEKEALDKNSIITLYTEAYENVTIITEDLLESYFIAHKNAVISLKNDSEKLFDYFQILSPAEKKAITYYLITKQDYSLTEIHINNEFFNNIIQNDHKYISEDKDIKTKFYSDKSKFVFGINDMKTLMKLL